MVAQTKDSQNGTSEELFDLVDSSDNVVGVERRAVVHKKKLMHRAIHVFVFNSLGQLYLQKRSLSKDSAPGKWVSSCAGHVDSGEDYDMAALRELGEELCLFEPKEFNRVFKSSPCKETGQEFVWVYTCESEGPFKLDPEESIEGRWVDLEQLTKWIKASPSDFSWSFMHLWQKYLKKMNCMCSRHC